MTKQENRESFNYKNLMNSAWKHMRTPGSTSNNSRNGMDLLLSLTYFRMVQYNCKMNIAATPSRSMGIRSSHSMKVQYQLQLTWRSSP
ncbi:hypothetical protein CR513_19955, partial [Mucuna pruriens]